MARHFKRGTFRLKDGVTDVEAFEEPLLPELQKILRWAKRNGISVRFGISERNTYLCEYDVVADTHKHCSGRVAELRTRLKPLFPRICRISELSGICW